MLFTLLHKHVSVWKVMHQFHQFLFKHFRNLGLIFSHPFHKVTCCLIEMYKTMTNRNILSIGQIHRQPPATTVDQNETWYCHIVTRDSVKVLWIYTETYNYIKLNSWNTTKLGKAILKCFRNKKFKHCLKCIFFDSEIARGDVLTWPDRHNIMAKVAELTFELNEQENIKMFISCKYCRKYTVLNFFMDFCSTMNTDLLCCEICLSNNFHLEKKD